MMYSRNSGGFFARSVFSRMARLLGVAVSAFGFHALHKNHGGFHVHQCFPFFQQQRQCHLELFAVSRIQQLFAAFRADTWTDTKHDPRSMVGAASRSISVSRYRLPPTDSGSRGPCNRAGLRVSVRALCAAGF